MCSADPAVDRRRSPRFPRSLPVRLTHGPEQSIPDGETVDVAREGLLARLPAPGRPLCPGDRVLLSFDGADGALHVLGRACRSLRGDDGRWYIAVEFDEVEPIDRIRLDGLLDLTSSLDAPYSITG